MLTVLSMVMDFAERCDDVAERLEDMTLAGKREIMRAVMERKGYVKLRRSPQGLHVVGQSASQARLQVRSKLRKRERRMQPQRLMAAPEVLRAYPERFRRLLKSEFIPGCVFHAATAAPSNS